MYGINLFKYFRRRVKSTVAVPKLFRFELRDVRRCREYDDAIRVVMACIMPYKILVVLRIYLTETYILSTIRIFDYLS